MTSLVHFDRLSQRVTEHVGRPWFFVFVLAMLVAWLPTLFFWDAGRADLLVDALTNPLSLVLIVLLQNSQNRGDRAKDVRQDQLERAMAQLLLYQAGKEGDAGMRRRLCEAADSLLANAEEATTMSSADTSR